MLVVDVVDTLLKIASRLLDLLAQDSTTTNFIKLAWLLNQVNLRVSLEPSVCGRPRHQYDK